MGLGSKSKCGGWVAKTSVRDWNQREIGILDDRSINTTNSRVKFCINRYKTGGFSAGLTAIFV